MPAYLRYWAWLTTFLTLIATYRASPYNPHLPDDLPWFEGWYTRVVDSQSDLSFGAITGYFPDQQLQGPSYFGGILRGTTHKSTTEAHEHLPTSIFVTGSDGRPVHKQPTQAGEPDFALHTADNSCNLTANGSVFSMSVVADGVTMTINGNAPGMPWGPDGETPEGMYLLQLQLCIPCMCP